MPSVTLSINNTVIFVVANFDSVGDPSCLTSVSIFRSYSPIEPATTADQRIHTRR